MYLIAIVLTAGLFAQQAPAQPDMTGTWKMIADRSGSPGQVPPVTEMTLIIQQSASDVRVEWQSGADKPIVTVYPIGPAPKEPAEPMGADQKLAYWDGARLVLDRGGSISGQTVSMKQSLTLDPAARELTVERLVIVQHGYTLKGTKNYATVKDVFARVGS
ncbi:MAG TPA: hypothetical protein VM096_20580 [Vicinamibacterales bacterium]|nr:hypothetical protein [Vicinamibacterales bacterium]